METRSDIIDQGTLRFMRTAGGLSHRNALRKKLIALTITRLEFLDDHRVLSDKVGPDADWQPGGTKYVDKEGGAHWKPGKSFPASVTKATKLALAVEIAVVAADTDPVDCVITATPTGGRGDTKKALRFEITATTGGAGTLKLRLSADEALPDEVFDCPDFSLAWSAKIGEKTFDLGTTGAHHLYVTHGTPNPAGAPLPTPFGSEAAPLEDGITEKRMSAAVKLTEEMWRAIIKVPMPEFKDRNDPHVIVRALMASVAGYTLAKDPSVPPEHVHPTYFNHQLSRAGAWPITEFREQKAECQAIVRMVRGILLQIGCPGDARLVVIYARSDVDGGDTPLEDSVIPPDGDATKYRMSPLDQKMHLSAGLHRDTPRVHAGLLQGEALTDSEVKVGDAPPLGTVFNAFEACLKFTHAGKTRYYGGGVPMSAFEDTRAVIRVFQQLVWTMPEPTDPPGAQRHHVTEISYPEPGKKAWP